MFGLEKKYMTCPQCEQFFKRPRRFCPFCGYRFEPEPEEKLEMYSGQRYQIREENTPLHRPRFSAPSQEEVFSSVGRSVFNDGYTQQDKEERRQTYAGISAEELSNMNDGTYFRSGAKKEYAALEKRAVPVRDDVFFSSKRVKEEMDKRNASQPPAPKHDPHGNP